MSDAVMFALSYLPSLLLVVGACATAVWASRLPEGKSLLIARLTGTLEADSGPKPDEPGGSS